jgi:DNA-directed RNA polymerase specialized sigma24 family protein
MSRASDAQLLREYVEEGNEPAFRQIVVRQTDAVYSAALRQVVSPDLARDVAQNVFTDLAHKAPSLSRTLDARASLLGWLYRSTRFAALNQLRDDHRRQGRERLAMQHFDPAPDPAPEWERIGPVLDEAMSQLGDEDREARQRLPLRRLMVEYGHAPKEPEGWRAFTCPHCGKKKKAGVFRGRDGAELFKCFSGRCPTMSVALDEVGYVAHVSRLNRNEAFKAFLKMAGVSDRRPPRENKEEGASDEDLLKQAGELAKEEGKPRREPGLLVAQRATVSAEASRARQAPEPQQARKPPCLRVTSSKRGLTSGQPWPDVRACGRAASRCCSSEARVCRPARWSYWLVGTVSWSCE